MSSGDQLEHLRSQMRDITADIIKQIKRRMEISYQIGDIKRTLNLDVKDEKVEQEIKNLALMLSDELGLDREFAGRIINVILNESIKVQQQKNMKEKSRSPAKITHLGIFMKAKEMEAAGREIIHLEVGEPDYDPPHASMNALIDSIKSRHYHYTETRGISAVRKAISEKVGHDMTENNIILTPGGRFAIFAAMSSLLKSGDEVVTIEPAWPAYRECADFIGATTKILKTQFKDQWNPDVDELHGLINQNTKMIAINYPNNPTGNIIDNSTMQKIVSLARDHKLYVLSDEVYSHYSSSRFNSLLEYAYDRSITVSSFSKTFAMTGFRVGYAVSAKHIIDKMTRVQALCITSVAEPIQYAALAVVNENTSHYARIIKKRIDLIARRLEKMNVKFVYPHGAMYIFPKLADGIDDISLIEKTLEKGLALAPGSGFGDHYHNFIRISVCQPENLLEKGMDILENSLRNYSS